MILVTAIAMIIVGVVLMLCCDAFSAGDDIGFGAIVIGGLVTFILLIILIINHTGLSGYKESLRQEYTALTYKIESEEVRDEFGLLNKEIVDEIQEWNTSLAKKKGNQNDFWIGVLIPNIYDEFEYIEYNKEKKE